MVCVSRSIGKLRNKKLIISVRADVQSSEGQLNLKIFTMGGDFKRLLTNVKIIIALIKYGNQGN